MNASAVVSELRRVAASRRTHSTEWREAQLDALRRI